MPWFKIKGRLLVTVGFSENRSELIKLVEQMRLDFKNYCQNRLRTITRDRTRVESFWYCTLYDAIIGGC